MKRERVTRLDDVRHAGDGSVHYAPPSDPGEVALETLADNVWCAKHGIWSSRDSGCPQCNVITFAFSGLFSRDVQ